MSHQIPRTGCPYCDYKVDQSSDPYGTDAIPHAGDISLCLECGKPSLYTEGLGLRIPSTDEMVGISLLPQVVEVQIVIAGLPPRKKNIDATAGTA